MSVARSFAILAAALAAMGLTGCGGLSGGEAPQTVASRSASDQRLGDQSHPQILAQFGGEYDDPRVTSYVRELGMNLAAQSEQPQGPWTFTVLDSPIINAFALPGGYVYVTRGLVALAADEAELASVIGHEIGHVTADHTAERRSRATVAQIGVLAATIGAAVLGADSSVIDMVGQAGSAVGQGVVASFSRSQELEADVLGVRYLARAGYDPFAQANFLESMQAQSELQARLSGGSYDANRVDFFATHPATAERVREAIRAAQAQGVPIDAGAPRNRERFLQAIDGMVYGDSREHGFVRGRRFVHPALRFEFSVPEQFEIANATQRVTAQGPGGAGLIFDGGRDPGGSLERYIARGWAPQIAQQTRTGRLQQLQSTRINGLEAATAYLPIATGQGERVAQLTAIRTGDGTVYRFFGLARPGDQGVLRRLDAAARSFRRLSQAEAAQARPYRIQVATAQAGDTVERLAARMPFDRANVERFRVLNDLELSDGLQPGDRVKLVTE